MLNGRVRFADFEADIAAGQLRRSGELVQIQDLPFRLLAALLEKPGEVVTRTELASRLWGSDTFVDATAGLNTAMAKLREALGDAAEQPAIIETIPKRGYRFIGRIESPESRGAANGEARADAPSSGAGDGPADDPAPQSARDNRRWGIGLAVAAAAIAFVATTAYQLRADRSKIRVAVVLFDNETGRPEMARFAQGLTDAVVTELTAQPALAVVGNAAVLRTERPFRDIAKVRDALNADYIVIGQVQTRDNGTIVRAHLIRGKDEAHVWVNVASLDDSEAALQADVAGKIRAAVEERAIAR